jgi:hypothetical protein
VKEILQILNAHDHDHENEQILVVAETTIMHHHGNHNQGLHHQTFAKVVEIFIVVTNA